jgi:hypothetical protein
MPIAGFILDMLLFVVVVANITLTKPEPPANKDSVKVVFRIAYKTPGEFNVSEYEEPMYWAHAPHLGDNVFFEHELFLVSQTHWDVHSREGEWAEPTMYIELRRPDGKDFP